MKKTHLIITMLAALSFTGCNFFTTSLGTSFKRDLSDTYDKMSTDDLADMITDPQVISDPQAGKQLLETLGERDPEDLKKLSPEAQDDILNLMVNSTISTEAITSAIDTLTNAAEGSDPAEIVSAILNNINEVDTKAAVALLDDSNIDNLEPSTAALAAISLVAQVAKSQHETNPECTGEVVMGHVGKILGGQETPQAAMSAIGITEGSPEAEALEAALGVVDHFMNSGESVEIFPGFDLSTILGSLGQ